MHRPSVLRRASLVSPRSLSPQGGRRNPRRSHRLLHLAVGDLFVGVGKFPVWGESFLHFLLTDARICFLQENTTLSCCMPESSTRHGNSVIYFAPDQEQLRGCAMNCIGGCAACLVINHVVGGALFNRSVTTRGENRHLLSSHMRHGPLRALASW